MQNQIEEELKAPKFTNQQDLKVFVKKMQSMILSYEQSGYDKEDCDYNLIKVWRLRLLEIIKENKSLPESTMEEPEEKEGIETLKILNRQLSLADTNQKILEKSSLKLIGLDYSADDIEKAIVDTRKKLESSRRREKQERMKLFYSFIFFISVCIYIIVDKARVRMF